MTQQFAFMAHRLQFPASPGDIQDMLYSEITGFLSTNGISCRSVTAGRKEFILAESTHAGSHRGIFILPAATRACTYREAEEEYLERKEAKEQLAGDGGWPVVTIAEDRWRRPGTLYRERLLSHLGLFRPVAARNCEVRRTGKDIAGTFLQNSHSYGMSSCRYCYAIYGKGETVPAGVATFSNARRWIKGGREIRSYEWVRYASSPGTRVIGGMGKLLSRFINDVRPDDIMSYADLEWSDGRAYRTLGFAEEGMKAPVLFGINREDWSRHPVSSQPVPGHGLYFMNDGSLKFRLKLTWY